MIRLGVMGKIPQKQYSLLITAYQEAHGINYLITAMLTLITWLRQCLPSFSIVKLLLFFPFPYPIIYIQGGAIETIKFYILEGAGTYLYYSEIFCKICTFPSFISKIFKLWNKIRQSHSLEHHCCITPGLIARKCKEPLSINNNKKTRGKAIQININSMTFKHMKRHTLVFVIKRTQNH